ncbi:hypothetical protein OIU79_024583 [Salix purpurea]|uniref:Transmembrane protein n=1 Tax=Salix purpurea TaxID=77065 RepID=A0A9Q1AAC5_SALPP|nr:hypothetical protein OIU79_024583 [Salix purpurea]
MACIISSSAALSTRSLISTDSIPTRSTRSTRSIKAQLNLMDLFVSHYKHLIQRQQAILNQQGMHFLFQSLITLCLFSEKVFEKGNFMNNMLFLLFCGLGYFLKMFL